MCDGHLSTMVHICWTLFQTQKRTNGGSLSSRFENWLQLEISGSQLRFFQTFLPFFFSERTQTFESEGSQSENFGFLFLAIFLWYTPVQKPPRGTGFAHIFFESVVKIIFSFRRLIYRCRKIYNCYRASPVQFGRTKTVLAIINEGHPLSARLSGVLRNL